jgi:hypothetical protein
MRQDGSLRPEFFPRCLMLSTGEEVPRGHSLRSRMFIIELNSGAITSQNLSIAQEHTSNGLYVDSMSGYIKWLSPKMNDIKKSLPARYREIRSKVQNADGHRRTPGIIASLYLGIEQFCNYAQEIGALSATEREKVEVEVLEALIKIGAGQSEYQRGEDPCQLFLESLTAVLIAGRAHLVNAENGGPPKNAERCGWRIDAEVIRHPNAPPQAEWKARGEKIG